MYVHEIIKISQAGDLMVWKSVLRKGYKPKTVHSVRERTDRGP